MSMLDRLKTEQRAIRFAEFATLIHDIDKADAEFLRDSHWHGKGYETRSARWAQYGFPEVSTGLSFADPNTLASGHENVSIRDILHNITIETPVGVSLSDAFAYHHHNKPAAVHPILSHIMHPGLGGADGIDSDIDKSVPKTNLDGSDNVQNDPFWIDTPFGMSDVPWGEQLTSLVSTITRILERNQVQPDADLFEHDDALRILMHGCLGETRFPCNDVTLWAHSHSVATLAKALLAKVLLEYPERPDGEPYLMPGRTYTLDNRTDYAFCRVSLDRNHLWSRAQKAGDLIGVADQVSRLQTAIQGHVETELLFGNQVARFQESQLFLMPRLGTWKSGEVEKLPTDIHKRFVAEVRSALHEFIVRWLIDNKLEDLPFAIDFESDAGCDQEEVSQRILARSSKLLAHRPAYHQSADALSGVTATGLRCEVCGIRGIGNQVEEGIGNQVKEKYRRRSRDEKLCDPCYARRHDKAMLMRRNVSEELVTSNLGILLRKAENKLALVYIAFDQTPLHDGSIFAKATWEAKFRGEYQTFRKNPSLGRLDRSRETMAKFLDDIAQEYHRFPLTLESTSDYTAFIVAANDVGEGGLLERIYTEYEARFGKFRDVLPLSVGVVFFYKKFPLYVVADILRSMRGALAPAEAMTYKVADPGYQEGSPTAHMRLEPTRGHGKGSLAEAAEWRVPTLLSNGAYDPYHPQFGGKRLRDLCVGEEIPAREGRFDFILAESAQTRHAFEGSDRRHHIFGGRPSYSVSAIPQFLRLKGLLSRLGHSQVSQIEGLLVEKMLAWGDAWWASENDGIIRGFCRTVIMSPNAFGARDRSGAFRNLGSDQEADKNLLLNAARNGMLLDAIDLYYHMLNSGQARDKAAANDRG